MVGRPVSAGTVRTKGLKVSVEVLESTSLAIANRDLFYVATHLLEARESGVELVEK